MALSSKLVSAAVLAKELFEPPVSVWWIREQWRLRNIRGVKVGGKVLFDPAKVREDLETRHMTRRAA